MIAAAHSPEESAAAEAERLRQFGLGFLARESREALVRVLFRLRRAGQGFVVAACDPASRPAIELALALALLPRRLVRAVSPDAEAWRALLDGRAAPDERGPADVLWVLRGVADPHFDTAVAGLNFHRDDFLVRRAALWLWVLPTDLDRLARRAPDLWRYRTAVLTLEVQPIRRLHLPHYVPPFPWPADPKRATGDAG